MGLSPLNLIGLSFSSLLGNPLRSFLSGIGVFMGVAAVSATLQVGHISRAVIEKQLAEQDAPQIGLFRGWNMVTDETVPLSLEDIELLRRRLQGIQAISGSIWAANEPVIFQDKKVNPDILPVTVDFLLTTGRPIITGRPFTQSDFESYRPVAIIDQFLVDELFPGLNPIGQSIYLNLRPYIVVGVVPTKATSFRREPTGELFIPITAYSSASGKQELDTIWLRPRNLDQIEALGEDVQKLFEQRFPGYKFNTWNTARRILEQKKTLDSVSKALLVVGAIALIVGGVGIANITIAAVIERTPEIGLRRAIGATQLDIMLQFILEAAIISFIGGVIAIVTVHGVTIVITQQFKLPYEFDSQTAAIALGSALFVGVGAGFFPALRASQLDPVKALRGQ